MRDCDICDGRKMVSLRVIRPLQPFTMRAETDPLVPIVSSRDFPCPQCSDQVATERLGILQHHAELWRDDTRYVEAAMTDAAKYLGREMLKHGFIQFEFLPPAKEDVFGGRLRATVGVVAPTVVASMEERIAERQTEIARHVVSEAARRIYNCGADYGWTSIRKERAEEILHEAIKTVLAKRAEWKQRENA